VFDIDIVISFGDLQFVNTYLW